MTEQFDNGKRAPRNITAGAEALRPSDATFGYVPTSELLGDDFAGSDLTRSRLLPDRDQFITLLHSLGNSLGNLVETLVPRESAPEKTAEQIQRFYLELKESVARLEQPTQYRTGSDLMSCKLLRDLLGHIEKSAESGETTKNGGSQLLLKLSSVIQAYAPRGTDDRVLERLNIRELGSGEIPQRYAELDTLVAINRKLLIDSSKLEPQHGFGRVLERPELEKILAEKNSRLFLMEYDGKIAGYFILHTSLESVPEKVREALAAPALTARIKDSPSAWAEVGGILPEFRVQIDRCGHKTFDLLEAAVEQSARAQRIKFLLGEIREGKQANLTKQSFVKRGWQETGVAYQGTHHPYQILLKELA